MYDILFLIKGYETFNNKYKIIVSCFLRANLIPNSYQPLYYTDHNFNCTSFTRLNFPQKFMNILLTLNKTKLSCISITTRFWELIKMQPRMT
jgi:hypothetical protein